MAITNAQQYKQLMQNGGRIGLKGGGADMGAPDRAQERSDRGYGDPGGGLAATNAPSQDRIAEIRQANITLENLKQDKIEEKLEKFRDLNSRSRKFTNFASKFSPIAKFASMFGPLNTRDFFTENYLSSKNAPMTKEQFANLTNEEQEDMFGDYMSGRTSGATDAYGNPIGDSIGGERDTPIIPQGIMAQAPSDMDQEPEEEDEIINYRLMADGGRAAFGGGSDMGSVADSKGNVGPGTGGYQGGELGGMGRGPGGDGPKGSSTNDGGGITNLTSKKNIPTLNTDFTKFDVKDLINLGLVDSEEENTKLVGLNQSQVDYLNKVGTKFSE